jgi:photosystem II stability/assembly factor-like uncharacterized protein
MISIKNIRVCLLLSCGFVASIQSQTEWTVRSPITIKNTLLSIAWNGTVLVAVGTQGEIQTSFDGVGWTKQKSGTTKNLRSISCSNNAFVAVGDSGTLFTSPDGIHWVQNDSIRLGNVVSAGDHFIALVGSGTWTADNLILKVPTRGVFSSKDGTTWSKISSDSTKTFSSVTWTGTQFVALAGNSQIGMSPDGITWTWHSLSRTLNIIRWTGEKLVGCNSNWSNYVASSIDGVSWTYDTIQGSFSSNFSLTDIAAHGDTIVAVDYAARIFESFDNGITWLGDGASVNVGVAPGHIISGALYVVLWAGNRFITVGSFLAAADGFSGGNICSLVDGYWKSYAFYSSTSADLYSVTSHGSQLVAVGDGGTIITSLDGITWVNRGDTSVTKNKIFSVIWSGAKYVAVGDAGTVITSPDGATWTKANSVTTDQLKSVAWTGSQFVAVGGFMNVSTQVNSNRVITSPDGVTWTDRGSPGSGMWNGVIWTGTTLVAVGEDDNGSSAYSSVVYTSTDGLTWTSQDAHTQYMGLYSVAYSGSNYVAVGGPVTYCGLTSTDGITWSNAGLGNGQYFRGVAWGKNRYVAVGDNGKIFSSASGSSWDSLTSGVYSKLYSVTYTGSQYVVVGATGTILTSNGNSAIQYKPAPYKITNAPKILRTEYYNLIGQRLSVKNDKPIASKNALVIVRRIDMNGLSHAVKEIMK